MAVFGGDLSTLPTPETPPLTIRSPELQFDYETPLLESSQRLTQRLRDRANKGDRPAPSEFQHEKLAAAVASLSETQLKRAIAWGEELALRDSLSMLIQKVRPVRGVKNTEAATAPLEPSSQSPKDQATIRSPKLQFDYETPLLEASKRGLERLRKKLNKP